MEKAQSLRKLARVGFESYVAKAYKEGKVTLRAAIPAAKQLNLLKLLYFV